MTEPRPPVSVVMPFAGDREAAQDAVAVLLGLGTGPGDELILADNSGSAAAGGPVIVVRASAERSPAHARNAGARAAGNDWILFLDADCRARGTLLEDYFEQPPAAGVGALAGEVAPAPGARTLAARYAAARSFLRQEAHLAHPYRPRAVAANLLVRRSAFEQLGGFYEGLRAAEDTDFCWRLQAAGWRLELRAQARVEHDYRATLGELRSQWRGYAAGRAWLARRYPGFVPEPALLRAARRLGRGRSRPGRGELRGRPSRAPGPEVRVSRADRPRFLALDALLALEELVGLALANRPSEPAAQEPADVVLVAGRFPVAAGPSVAASATLGRVRVEAAARPEVLDLDVARSVRVDYREDDGALERLSALVGLLARHPVRCALDGSRRRAGEPGLLALAPGVLRVQRDAGVGVAALGEEARLTARRLGTLAGRRSIATPPR